MNSNIPFYVYDYNTFDSNMGLDDIKNDFKKNHIEYSLSEGTLITKDTYEFFINGSKVPLRTRLICHKNEIEKSLILYSEHKFTFPKVEFDKTVSYGNGCDDNDIQYVLDFNKNVIYIIGSDINESLGKK